MHSLFFLTRCLQLILLFVSPKHRRLSCTTPVVDFAELMKINCCNHFLMDKRGKLCEEWFLYHVIFLARKGRNGFSWWSRYTVGSTRKKTFCEISRIKKLSKFPLASPRTTSHRLWSNCSGWLLAVFGMYTLCYLHYFFCWKPVLWQWQVLWDFDCVEKDVPSNNVQIIFITFHRCLLFSESSKSSHKFAIPGMFARIVCVLLVLTRRFSFFGWNFHTVHCTTYNSKL